MAIPNSDYWRQRMKMLEDALLDDSYEAVKNIEEQFRKANKTLEGEILSWYKRFAKNNEISLAEAKRLLTTEELEEFHWTVQDYIEHGQQLDPKWFKKLENASDRVHVSRLESVQLQLQQHAEELYSKTLKATEQASRETYREGYDHTVFELQKGTGLGWSFQGINKTMIDKVLSKPWSTDMKTFRDRCWTNKEALVNAVNKELTQMLMRGEAPDRAIAAIAKQFDVAKSKAGRLIMTESAAFASTADRDVYEDLGVEEFQIVGTLDNVTCPLCGSLDGKHYPMSEYEVGVTAPPFHPWCRCTTIPYYDDWQEFEGPDDHGERAAREQDGKYYTVPHEMTYEAWQGYNKAIVHEPKVSATVKAAVKAAVENAGAELYGWEYRQKTAYSYSRKFNSDVKEAMEDQGLTYEQASRYVTDHVYDTVRYTALVDFNEFAKNYDSIIYELKQSGYNLSRVKNSLPDIGASYRGLNCVLTTPGGFNFELQFHTTETMATKDLIHPLFEEARKTTTSETRKAELQKQMLEISEKLVVPKGAETIKSFDNLK